MSVVLGLFVSGLGLAGLVLLIGDFRTGVARQLMPPRLTGRLRQYEKGEAPAGYWGMLITNLIICIMLGTMGYLILRSAV